MRKLLLFLISTVWLGCGPSFAPSTSPGHLARTPALFIDSDVEHARLGHRLSAGDVNGDGFSDAIVVSPGAHIRPESRIRVYHGGPAGLQATPDWSSGANPAFVRRFQDAACAGDVNGDGFDDVVATDPFANGDDGQVALFLGTPQGLAPDAWTVTYKAHVAAAAGDINGDGYDDFVVANTYNHGLVSLFLGAPDQVAAEPAWTWSEPDQDPGTYEFHGSSLAPAGDVNGDGFDDLLFGSFGIDQAFLFLGSPRGLAQRPDWFIPEGITERQLGFAASSAGDVNADGYADVLVGSDTADVAMLFLGSSSGLSPEPSFRFTGQDGSKFGAALASAGDVNGDGYGDVIIGAWMHDDVWVDEGAAFLYFGSEFGILKEPEQLNTNQLGAQFGFAVSAAGDVNGDGGDDFFVGAPYYNNGLAQEGEFYLYLGDPPPPVPPAEDPPLVEGDSAPNEDTPPTAKAPRPDDCGCQASAAPVLLFPVPLILLRRRRAPRWIGGLALLVACEADPRSPLAVTRPPVAAADWTHELNVTGAQLGWSVAGGGDVNGDGFADVLASAFNSDGSVHLFHGSGSGLPSTPSWSRTRLDHPGVGESVAFAGDVNGDGYDDVLFSGLVQEGGGYRPLVHLAAGSPTGLDRVAAGVGLTFERYVSRVTVASAGDVNGDGLADVAIGVTSIEYQGSQEEDAGRVNVYYGSVGGLSQRADWSAQERTGHVRYGSGVSSAGDVNGDGYDDLIVGLDNRWDNRGPGMVFVYHGSPEGLSRRPDWQVVIPEDESFGMSVAGAGDVNGDGYDDVLVGAPGIFEEDEGRARLFFGGAAGLETSPGWTAVGGQADSEFGYWLSSAGDVNADGLVDIVVGAPEHEALRHDEGQIFVYENTPAGLPTTPTWTVSSGYVEGNLGRSVTSAGDVDGDGDVELIVGAPTFGYGEVSEGRIFLFGRPAPEEEPPEEETPEEEGPTDTPAADTGPSAEPEREVDEAKPSDGCSCGAAPAGGSAMMVLGALLPWWRRGRRR